MGAVRERVIETSALRVERFAQTVRAGGRIRYDAGFHLSCDACDNLKSGESVVENGCVGFRSNVVDPGQGWSFCAQPGEKPNNGVFRPAYCCQDTRRIIPDFTAETFFFSQMPNKWTETDTLHKSCNANSRSVHWWIRCLIIHWQYTIGEVRNRFSFFVCSDLTSVLPAV